MKGGEEEEEEESVWLQRFRVPACLVGVLFATHKNEMLQCVGEAIIIVCFGSCDV